jgi:serine/threonine-protein kinase
MSDFVSSRINRYEIGARIGAGGMARVFKGWDTTLQRPVAIKILYEHLSEDSTFQERFLREARFVANLNHPHIVQVYDFDMFQRDGFMHYYMVMSYIPGKSLRELLETANQRGERLDLHLVIRIAQNLADALDYAHRQGMVHRDVKPSNILMNENNDAVLTDFGIARMIESNRLTQEGISTGTPLYMSPEQTTGQSGDARSDLYSFGVIVYEMLTGQPPFVDSGLMSVMMKHLSSPIPSISSSLNIINPALDAVLTKALAKSPTDRYQTAQDFINDLLPALHSLLPAGASLALTPSGRTSALPLSTNPSLLTTPVPPLPINPASITGVPAPSVTQTIQHTATVSFAFLGGVVLAAIIIVIGAIFILRDQISQPASTNDTAQNAAQEPISLPMRSASELYFETDFDPDDPNNRYWAQGTLDRFTQTITPEGFYQLVSSRSMTAETSIIYSEQPYGSIGIEMIAALTENSAVASGYGIVFRYQDSDNYNVFAIDGVGRFSIWTRENGIWDELRDAEQNWTPNEAIRTMGQQNRLALEIVNSRLTGYVNNRRVTTVRDSTFADGQIGIYFATDQGEATILVDSFKVYPSVPSMTAPIQ